MRTLKKLFTAEDLLCLSATGKRLELVKGKVYEMAPAGGRHGYVAMNIGTLMGGHARSNRLGRVFAAETGFIIRHDPDTVRAPDVAFVSQNRLSADEIPDGYIDLIPDLVVEVVSPNDCRREVREKVEEWLNAGVRLAWGNLPRNPNCHGIPVAIRCLQFDGGRFLGWRKRCSKILLPP